jgi:type IV pilus assembly protein PilZ
MSEGGRERRESGRAALELPVEYDRLNALLSDYTHNISRGGTFIRTDRPLDVGTVLSFTLRAPELGEPIVLRGVVRWVVDAGQAGAGRAPGMGIAFVYDSPAHRESLEARLDRLMVQSLGAAAFEQLMGKPAPPEPADDGPA